LCFVGELEKDDFELSTEEQDEIGGGSAFKDLFKQYEHVVVKSIITAFALDGLLIKDKNGGDVDTLHTVMDDNLSETDRYKNEKNREAYDNRTDYKEDGVGDKVHKNEAYIKQNREYSQLRDQGNLCDAYSGKRFKRNEDFNQDHVISAKEVHDDRRRVLAEIATEEIANRESNLVPVHERVNKAKGKKSAVEFSNYLKEHEESNNQRSKELKRKESLTDKERQELMKLEQFKNVDHELMLKKDKESRANYESELAVKYYSSQKFIKDTIKGGVHRGFQMGLRQGLGMILAEVWFETKEAFPKILKKMKGDFDLGRFLSEFCEMLKRIFNNVCEKYKELISSVKDGLISGVLASLTTTVINIFATTAKNIVRIIRQTWSSIVEAVRVLVFNPDDLPFGEQLKAVAKIVATCGSVIVGSMVQESVSKVELPILGGAVSLFVGSFVTGVMTVSLLYFIDNSKIVKKIVEFANKLAEFFKDGFDRSLEFFNNINKQLDEYVAKLARIDYEAFRKEILDLRELNIRLSTGSNDETATAVLYDYCAANGIDLQFNNTEEFVNFMSNEEAILEF
jgi:hypothetical protein